MPPNGTPGMFSEWTMWSMRSRLALERWGRRIGVSKTRTPCRYPCGLASRNNGGFPCRRSGRPREGRQKLDRFFDRIASCDVTIKARHRRRHKGKLYKVRIDIGVPGNDAHVNQEGHKNKAHEDINVAIRDAFGAAVRKLDRVRLSEVMSTPMYPRFLSAAR